MPAKKSSTKTTGKKKPSQRNPQGITRVHGAADLMMSSNGYDDDFEFHPIETRRNPPPSPEAEAKRRARRKALTLRAFQTAYDNVHRRKAS